MNMIAKAASLKMISPLQNLLSGILLRISNPFKTGDFIEVDGQLGSVKKRGMQKTVISNLDGSFTVIENGKFYTSSLHNLSAKNIIRLAFTVKLCYTTDMVRAKEAINNFLSKNPKVLDTPAPKLQVVKLGEKFVEISVQPWCLLDHFLELDLQLGERLELHLASLGFQTQMAEDSYEQLGVTA